MALEIREQLLELSRVMEEYLADMDKTACDEQWCMACDWAGFCERGWPPGRVVSLLRVAAKS